ncbi:hypothetical protein DAT39_013631 [Clarias magur]|uniref:Uncharacterized protein n=1 Tax=Clarias magur TaxID=1594786 RepID=A0A8J4TY22_CLAMG|nr:hypothetical protein DAT39_013631 [Clarias magur]
MGQIGNLADTYRFHGVYLDWNWKANSQTVNRKGIFFFFGGTSGTYYFQKNGTIFCSQYSLLCSGMPGRWHPKLEMRWRREGQLKKLIKKTDQVAGCFMNCFEVVEKKEVPQ